MSTVLRWFKSSCSGSDGGNYLEAALRPTAVHVRDSRTPAAPHLTVAPAAWAAFPRLTGDA
ncbi:DUF397 domain-containing protein [Streptomyces sp. NPDC059168]|uniref:DUF397 domain-containing protein n=1 Tax=Streptomyces sp. NPDC059168 TaxID=3346753 RepID=UPI0036AF2111